MTRLRLHLLAVVAGVLPLATAAAQQSILFTPEVTEHSRTVVGLEGSSFRNGEIAVVTPRPGFEAARVFLSGATQWAFLGDANNNGRLVDSANDAPGNVTDAIMIKRFRTPGGLGARDVFVSKSTTFGMSSSTENGSLFRYATQGAVEVFVAEDQLLTAIGQVSTADLNVDAICQTPSGDLFLSFDRTESVNGTDATNRAIVRIPAGAIFYNLQGNVISIQSGAAEIVATAVDTAAMISASGVKTAARGNPSTSQNITALALDPAGGTWMSPVTGAFLPNLVFGWFGGSNDGALVSTAAGGTIAVVNGQLMGSTVETNGSHLGLLPRSGGINGLHGVAIADTEIVPAPSVENYPINLVTTNNTLFVKQEVTNATPGAPVAFFLSFQAGPIFQAFPVPGFGGEIFGNGLLLSIGSGTADANGYVSNSLQLPTSAVARRLAVVWQCFDAGTWSFGLPAAMQFQ